MALVNIQNYGQKKLLYATKQHLTQYAKLMRISLTLKPHLHHTTCCQTGLTPGCIMYTNIQPVVKPFDNRLYRVYTRLSNRVVQPV